MFTPNDLVNGAVFSRQVITKTGNDHTLTIRIAHDMPMIGKCSYILNDWPPTQCDKESICKVLNEMGYIKLP